VFRVPLFSVYGTNVRSTAVLKYAKNQDAFDVKDLTAWIRSIHITAIELNSTSVAQENPKVQNLVKLVFFAPQVRNTTLILQQFDVEEHISFISSTPNSC